LLNVLLYLKFKGLVNKRTFLILIRPKGPL
jgi:hypothetical protein